MFMLTADLIRNDFYREHPSPLSQPTERFTIEHTVFEYQITEYFASSRALKPTFNWKSTVVLRTQGERERITDWVSDWAVGWLVAGIISMVLLHKRNS